MASGDARPVPRRNTAYRVTFPILDADGDLVTGATGLDSEVSKDAGTFTDCTNEATEIATSSGIYYLDLTATEMDADTVAVIVKTSSTGAKTTVLVFYPEEAGDVRVDVVQISGDATAADNCEAMFDGTGYAGGTTKLDVNVATIASGAITATAVATGAIDADALATDAVNEIADGLMTRASSNWEASAPVKSLGTAVMKAVHRTKDNAGTLEIYRSNGTTVHASQTVTTDANNLPIDELTGAA